MTVSTRTGFPSGITVGGVPVYPQLSAIPPRNNVYHVDTRADVGASDGNDGKSWEEPFATMAGALAAVQSHDVILSLGKITEQLTAPQDVFGVRIIGAAGGQNRHADGDNILNASAWIQAAVAGNAPLLTSREQGWEFHNFLFVPQSGYSAVKLHRTELAAAMDGSHAIFRNCKFIGAAQAGYGIEDYGGMHHVLIENCEFHDLDSGILATNVSIAAPLRNVIRYNIFEGNKNDIRGNYSKSYFIGNDFKDVYHATTHPTTINLAYTADTATGNVVRDNWFGDAAADVTIVKGYKPSTGDRWANHVSDTAAYIVTVPA